jgi:O-acetyl-ADP-ribose deacetylase (regulator of RNase III)
MIEYRKGDMFADNHEIIVHGVNCQGVMGSGIAKIIRQKYPWSYDAYKEYCNTKTPENLLGTNKHCSQENSVLIVHCFTQLNYGLENKRYVSYDAIDDCMKSLARAMVFKGISGYIISKIPIAMPKIGSGLGGGNWNVIEAIINDRLRDLNVIVYEL